MRACSALSSFRRAEGPRTGISLACRPHIRAGRRSGAEGYASLEVRCAACLDICGTLSVLRRDFLADALCVLLAPDAAGPLSRSVAQSGR